jgi:hypothetical protein
LGFSGTGEGEIRWFDGNYGLFNREIRHWGNYCTKSEDEQRKVKDDK